LDPDFRVIVFGKQKQKIIKKDLYKVVFQVKTLSNVQTAAKDFVLQNYPFGNYQNKARY
jgi:hypothetical protein